MKHPPEWYDGLSNGMLIGMSLVVVAVFLTGLLFRYVLHINFNCQIIGIN